MKTSFFEGAQAKVDRISRPPPDQNAAIAATVQGGESLDHCMRAAQDPNPGRKGLELLEDKKKKESIGFGEGIPPYSS